jgi:hypothetical protein
MIKKLALLSVALIGVVSSTGCETPAYSARERNQMIARNWDMEWKMITDDIDYIMLFRPMSSLTRWNIK